jgi:hypothetical protein
LGFAGGILAIENVAGNEYDIHLTLCDDLYKLIEDGEMLRLSAVPSKGVADVPIRCMENAHQLEISDDCFMNNEHHQS